MCPVAAHVGRVNPRVYASVHAGARSSPPINPAHARDESERWSGAGGDTMEIYATRHLLDVIRKVPQPNLRLRAADHGR